MTTKQILGYADPWSIKAGETVSFMVSGIGINAVDAKLVRLIHGDENPDGPGFIEEEVASALPASLNIKHQFSPIGSHAVVTDPGQILSPTGDFTLYAFVSITKPGPDRQVILGKWDATTCKGYALGINKCGQLEFWVGDGMNSDRVTVETGLLRKTWYFVAASYNATSREAKLQALEDAVAELKIGFDESLAVGDGANDLAMIQKAGLGVAYHAKPVVAAAAGAAIAHNDLTALLYLQGYKDSEISRV